MSPVFVVGCDRSGTSLLTLILNQSPDLKMIFEAGFLPRLESLSSDYGDFSAPRQRWYFIRDIQREKATSRTFAFEKFESLSDQEAELALREAAPTNYRGAANAIYSAAARKEGKGRWGEKMPRYITQVEWLATMFPDSHIVHIIRDPRDVAASMCRAGFEESLHDAAERWAARVAEGRRQGRTVESRYHEVQYEKLLQNPTETVKSLAECLGIAFDSEMTQGTSGGEDIPESHRKSYPGLFAKLDQPIDPNRAFAWKRELVHQEIAEIEKVANSVMKKVGYKATGYKVSFWKKRKEWAREKALAVILKIKTKLKSI
jgi:hypothetical protein